MELGEVLKNTIDKINPLNGLKSILDTTEERINEIKYRVIEAIQTEA